MLTVGQPLPSFAGDVLMPNGEIAQANLVDYRGKWIVLFFYPLDFSQLCLSEIHGYHRLHAEFEKAGALVFGASVDSAHCHKAWVERDLGQLAFPLISDLNRTLAQGCGVLSEEGAPYRATFIVSPTGVIESVAVNSNNIGRSIEETLRLLLALQAEGMTPCDWQPGQPLLNAA